MSFFIETPLQILVPINDKDFTVVHELILEQRSPTTITSVVNKTV